MQRFRAGVVVVLVGCLALLAQDRLRAGQTQENASEEDAPELTLEVTPSQLTPVVNSAM